MRLAYVVAVVTIMWLFLCSSVGYTQAPSNVTCSVVRQAVKLFGPKRSLEWARKNLTQDQIRKARLCLKGATGRRRR